MVPAVWCGSPVACCTVCGSPAVWCLLYGVGAQLPAEPPVWEPGCVVPAVWCGSPAVWCLMYGVGARLCGACCMVWEPSCLLYGVWEPGCVVPNVRCGSPAACCVVWEPGCVVPFGCLLAYRTNSVAVCINFIQYVLACTLSSCNYFGGLCGSVQRWT